MQFCQQGSLENPASPSDFVWESRLLLIKGDGNFSLWFDEKLVKDLSERKLLVFRFNENSLVHSNFRGELKTAEFLKLIPKKVDQPVAWILIGLDGGKKSSGVSVPKPQEIFRTIDAMPMRQSELIKKGNQDNSIKN